MALASAAERLTAAVAAVCPILGVSIGTKGDSSTVRLAFDPSATPTQQTNAQAVVDAFDWSDSAQSSYDNTLARTLAVGLLSDPAATMKALRGLLLVALDEINLLRQRLTDQDSAVAAATSLANLQSRWATVATNDPMPQRTANQERTAVTGKINGGQADS